MDVSVTIKPHGHHKSIDSHPTLDKSTSSQEKSKGPSHSYSQLRPVRGDGTSANRLSQSTSPILHKQQPVKENESDTRGWENGHDDGGWSLGAPARGSGWNGTGKPEGNMSNWQDGMNTLNCGQSALSRAVDSNQPKDWTRGSSKSNSNTLAWADSSKENISNSISENSWGLPQDSVEPLSSKHLDPEMTFELDLESGKDDTFYPEVNWTTEELEPKHNVISSPRHEVVCFSNSPKVPQVADIVAAVDKKGVAETGYIPFGNPLKQVHSSDRRWTSKDSVSSTGSSAGGGSIQSPQRCNMNGRLFQGKLGGSAHSKLSGRGEKGSSNYNRMANKPKNMNLLASDSSEREPTGWGDLPSPNADLVDNGTSDWARPMARERQRMLIKSQLDGINGWDTSPVVPHWDDSSKNIGWTELSHQPGHQNIDDNEGWCTVNGKPSKTETFNQQVRTLVEMGFQKEDCERLLKTNNCNLEHALGDLLALKCTEEMNMPNTTEITNLQSVTTTTAASATSMLAKNAVAAAMINQPSVSSLTTAVAGTASTTSGGNMWSNKPATALPSSLSSLGPLSVPQGVGPAGLATLPVPQGQFNPQMLQPPVLPAKLLNEFSTNAATVGQQKQQLVSHLKLVNYHLAFLTKMQQTLFQKLSIFNDTSALISGLPPPLVQQQKQELLLQLQQVNTMIVIYSQQSILLKQLSSSANSSGASGSKSPKPTKAATVASPDSDKDLNEPCDQKHDKQTEGMDKKGASESVASDEKESSLLKESSAPDQVSVEQTPKLATDVTPEEENDAEDEGKGVKDTLCPAVNETDYKDEKAHVSLSSESLSMTATNPTVAMAPSTLSSVSTFDDDSFPPEFQPGKLWVPRSQAAESSQQFPLSKPNGLQPMTTPTKSVSVPIATKPVQVQIKQNKFAPHFPLPQNSAPKVGMPSGIAPMANTAVRPGIPPMGNKFTPSTRQIQNSINNLMFAQLGNNAAAAAAARKGNFPSPNVTGGFARPGKKNMPMPQFPPPFINGNNFGSFPNLPQPAMPPPPPQMGAGFPVKNQLYSPHAGMKKSSSFPGKPPNMMLPAMHPQQHAVFNYPNKPGRGIGNSGGFHSSGALPPSGNGLRQQIGSGWDAHKYGSFDSLRPPIQQHQQRASSSSGLGSAVDQQFTAPLSLGESLWSDNPRSPVSITSPDPTFAEWQAGKKAHINYFKLPSNSPCSWLVFRNLPPQIDHTTLKDLCASYGAVQTFYMNEMMQSGLVRYSCSAEATEAKVKLERATLHGISLQVDFASDNDIGEFIDSMSPPRQGSPPPLSFTATATSDDYWEDSVKTSSASDSKWFSTTAPVDILSNSDTVSSAAWKGGDLFTPWSTRNNESVDTDNSNHLATSPSMATFLPNGLL